MAVSFSNIPSGIRVPLFYAELDNSQANTATSVLKTLHKLIDAVRDIPAKVVSRDKQREQSR